MGASTNFGDDEYLTITGLYDNAGTSFTYLVWFKVDVAFPVGGFRSLITGTDARFAPMLISSSDNIRVYLDGAYRITSATTIDDLTWYCAALTFDGGSGSGVARLYQSEGSDDLILTETSSAFDITISNTGIRTGFYPAGATFDFLGSVAYLHNYNRVLSINELNEIKNKPGSIVDSLVSYHPMFCSASNIDYSGNGNNGSVTGSPTPDTSGPPVFLTGIGQ